MIGIINTKNANIRAISNIYSELGVKYCIINNSSDFNNISKLIIPGVGNYDAIIKNLKNSNLFDAINDFATILKNPILGICIGMHVFFNSSEEGKEKGFGWIDNEIVKLNAKNVRYPHMGWNSINISENNLLFNQIDSNSYFYFLHEYGLKNKQNDSSTVYGYTKYGEEFISAIIYRNFYGVQFHPEKSHNNGIKLLNNFSKVDV